MRLGGSSEVAKELGVSSARITVLRQRPDFPDPIGQTAQGPILDLDVIQAWQNMGRAENPIGAVCRAEPLRSTACRGHHPAFRADVARGAVVVQAHRVAFGLASARADRCAPRSRCVLRGVWRPGPSRRGKRKWITTAGRRLRGEGSELSPVRSLHLFGPGAVGR